MCSPIEALYADPLRRLKAYAESRRLILRSRLGFGQDGIVYQTDLPSALKAFKHRELFDREVRVYERIARKRVTHVGRFAIPKLIDADAENRVIEMSVVRRPFVLGFSAAGLDRFDNDWSQDCRVENHNETSPRRQPWRKSGRRSYVLHG
ncbi:MAG: hypothetical protein AAF532_11670 [Planctomycetota bacterium]